MPGRSKPHGPILAGSGSGVAAGCSPSVSDVTSSSSSEQPSESAPSATTRTQPVLLKRVVFMPCLGARDDFPRRLTPRRVSSIFRAQREVILDDEMLSRGNARQFGERARDIHADSDEMSSGRVAIWLRGPLSRRPGADARQALLLLQLA